MSTTDDTDDDATPAKFNRPTTPERAKQAAKTVAERAAAKGNPVAKKITKQIKRDERKGRK